MTPVKDSIRNYWSFCFKKTAKFLNLAVFFIYIKFKLDTTVTDETSSPVT